MTDPSLARRRKLERTENERRQFLKDDFNASRIAHWEQRSSNRIHKQDIFNRAKKIAEKDAENLEQRRQKIKELYLREAEQWKKELEELNYVSMEERMEIIRAKATSLMKKREKERQEYVKSCYDRQWRKGCDEARALDAIEITKKLMHDRKHAVTAREEEEENTTDANNTTESSKLMLELERKEREEAIERQRKNMETKLVLDAQVALDHSRKEKARTLREKEEAEQLERWKEEDAREKEKKLQLVRDEHRRGVDVAQANAKRQDERMKLKAAQRQEQQFLLDYALGKERDDIQREEQRRQENKGTAREFMKFLDDQMIKDKEDSSKVEQIRDEQMNKIWTKREEDQKARNDAHVKLMADVNYTRKQQILDKQRRKESEREEMVHQVKKNILEWEEEQRAEEQKQARKKKETIDNMLMNKKMVEEKLQREALEKQQRFFANKQIAYAEEQHQHRVENMCGGVQTHFPRRGRV